MANDGRQLESGVLKWLSANGYPLEMRIARSLAQRGFGVTQSHYYKDFESGAPREIDVVGRLYSFIEPEEYVAIAELETFVVAECKSCANPWVVFCETQSHAWNIQQAACNNSAEKLLIRARKQLQKTELLARASKSGHGVAQALGGNSDVPYAALLSALKAAEAHAVAGRETEVRLANDPEMANVSESVAAIPVVVITSPLFECRLGENGEPELTAVNHSSVAFRYPSGENRLRVGTTVHIVTESGWAEFEDAVKGFHEAAVSMLNTLIPRAKNGD